MANSDNSNFNTQQMLDIACPEKVEIVINKDRSILWVNVDGICRLRICRIQKGRMVIDDQIPEQEFKAYLLL